VTDRNDCDVANRTLIRTAFVPLKDIDEPILRTKSVPLDDAHNCPGPARRRGDWRTVELTRVCIRLCLSVTHSSDLRRRLEPATDASAAPWRWGRALDRAAALTGSSVAAELSGSTNVWESCLSRTNLG
jgi:hypothetical protein